MSCNDTTFLMSQARERKLSLSEKLMLRVHAAMCDGCSNFERQIPRLGDAARALAAVEPGQEPF